MHNPKSPPATPADVAEWRALHHSGWSLRAIARRAGRHHETIRYQLYPERLYRRREEREAARQAVEADIHE